MAMGLVFTCDRCGFSIEVWDDGNPYYLDKSGTKHYAYHPDHEKLAKCIGNDSPHICLECGEQFKVDSRSPIDHCRKCNADTIIETFLLTGRRCPSCKRGNFDQGMGCGVS
ncbi:hypothetical protein BH10PLA1_BH10PLA1_00520 [soil metagenome]